MITVTLLIIVISINILLMRRIMKVEDRQHDMIDDIIDIDRQINKRP